MLSILKTARETVSLKSTSCIIFNVLLTIRVLGMLVFYKVCDILDVMRYLYVHILMGSKKFIAKR
jgi:hypothetical protein